MLELKCYYIGGYFFCSHFNIEIYLLKKEICKFETNNKKFKREKCIFLSLTNTGMATATIVQLKLTCIGNGINKFSIPFGGNKFHSFFLTFSISFSLAVRLQNVPTARSVFFFNIHTDANKRATTTSTTRIHVFLRCISTKMYCICKRKCKREMKRKIFSRHFTTETLPRRHCFFSHSNETLFIDMCLERVLATSKKIQMGKANTCVRKCSHITTFAVIVGKETGIIMSFSCFPSKRISSQHE